MITMLYLQIQACCSCPEFLRYSCTVIQRRLIASKSGRVRRPFLLERPTQKSGSHVQIARHGVILQEAVLQLINSLPKNERRSDGSVRSCHSFRHLNHGKTSNPTGVEEGGVRAITSRRIPSDAFWHPWRSEIDAGI